MLHPLHDAFGPCSTTVAMNDPLNIRQADPSPFEFVLAVQASKRAKKFIGIPRIESSPVVTNEDYFLITIAGNAANLDFGFGASSRKLHRIGNQIDQGQAQERPGPPLPSRALRFPMQ